MPKQNNINIDSVSPLPSPAELIARHPQSEEDKNTVCRHRQAVEAVLSGADARHIMVVGPCSIHNAAEGLEYAGRLKELSIEVEDVILPVMRVYFEKPRTTVGWKGLIYDPDLNDSYNIENGIETARRLMLDIVDLGLPVGTEILDPIITQYIADLVSWAAIGARTTESQTHRQLVSGLSMPTGFKNSTDGNIGVAVDAIKAAGSKHSFIGVLQDGRVGIFRTGGNKFCHLILRGGNQGANYGSEYIHFAGELMRKSGLNPKIMVDCSHANSNKQPEMQLRALRDIAAQIAAGETAIFGTMLESNLAPGRQDAAAGKALDHGVSITDACLGWEESAAAIRQLAESLRDRRG